MSSGIRFVVRAPIHVMRPLEVWLTTMASIGCIGNGWPLFDMSARNSEANLNLVDIPEV